MNIRAKVFGGGSGEPALIKAKAPKGVRGDDLHAIPVTRNEARRANTREDDRHRLGGEAVEVAHEGRSYALQLVNLSGGGAMVAGKLPARLWDHVELRLGDDGRIECAVCWIKGDRIGLEFAVETRLDCSPTEQATVLREVIARSFPDVAFEVAATTTPSVPAEPKAPEQRDGRRHPLIWLGIVHYNFESSPVRLRNISATGAMIECSVPLPVDADPLLELGDHLQIPSRVTWAIGDAAGLRFDHPFDLSHLAKARPEVAHGHWQRPSYLGGRLSDPAGDERWRRMTLSELRDELEGFWKR
jgi:hypothetical protein